MLQIKLAWRFEFYFGRTKIDDNLYPQFYWILSLGPLQLQNMTTNVVFHSRRFEQLRWLTCNGFEDDVLDAAQHHHEIMLGKRNGR